MKAEEFIRKLQEKARESRRRVIVSFVVRHCGWLPCLGYHPTEMIVAYPNGDLAYLPSRYGIHSVVFPLPSLRKVSFDEAVKISANLLRRERKATRNPCLSWREKLDSAQEVE